MSTKVQQVFIKEFKCLEDFKGDFNGQNVLLVADNERGKSSVLQFLGILFGDTEHIPPSAIAEGYAIITRNGEQYTVKATIPGKKSKVDIEIHTPSGGVLTAKGAIHEMFGSLPIDIDHFVELSKTKSGQKLQVDEVKKLYPVSFIEEMNAQKNRIKMHEEDRTQIGRDRDNVKGRIKLHPLYNFVKDLSDLDKYQQVDVSNLLNEQKIANKHNDDVSRCEVGLEGIKKEIASIEDQIKSLEILRDEKKKKEVETTEWLTKNPKKDVDVLTKKIEEAGMINKQYDQAQQLKKDLIEAEKFESQYGEMTVLIETSRQCIDDAIRDQQPPIPGLEFDDEKLIWNGIPVHPDSLSESQIMELGIRIIVAKNQELPLMIQRTESFGQKRWELILQIAKDLGLQVIGEKVQRGQEQLIIEVIPELPSTEETATT